MPPKKRKTFKIKSNIEDAKKYILEIYAGRYLWNLGYRCIGFGINISPYNNISVVGIKTENKSIAIFDIVNNRNDFYKKSRNVNDLEEEEKELFNKITKITKIYRLENREINFKEDKIWINLVENISKIENYKNQTLYWHMINTYSVSNYNWIIGFEKDLKDIKSPDGWGMIKLKNTILDNGYKTYKVSDAPKINTSFPIDKYIQDIQFKIAFSLTKDVIGSDLLRPHNIPTLFKYLSDKENINLKFMKLEKDSKKAEKEFRKSLENMEVL